MSEKSSRVPEWYTSGSWPNAFDNTGWQKSPEYALIRIAAGAPDLAKSGQIRPRTAPDGKSSRIWRQGSLLLPRLKSFPELFFPDDTHRSPIRRLVPEARRVLRQSPTHSANVRTLRKTLAENRRQGSTTFCTLCTPCTTETDTRAQTVHTRNTDVHTCAQPRHNSRHKWQRTHRPCVALVGGRRRADASFCERRIVHKIFLRIELYTLDMFILFGCYSRYAKR